MNLADDSRFTRNDARDHAQLFHLQEKLVGKKSLERGQLVSSSQQRVTHQSRDVHHLQLSSANRLTGKQATAANQHPAVSYKQTYKQEAKDLFKTIC